MTDTAQTKITLKAEARTVLGKSVRSLRKTGIIPANIYGKDFESKAVKLNALEFANIYRNAGETSVVYIDVDGKTIPTLISDIQYHPLHKRVLHVDLRKVDLKKKIEADVPVEFVGESEAIKSKNGVLITQKDSITIEALPTNIPHSIEIDLSALKEIGDEIRISSIPKSDTYEIVDDLELVIVSVTQHVEEEIEVQTTSEAPEIITEKPAEGEEGGEAPADANKE